MGGGPAGRRVRAHARRSAPNPNTIARRPTSFPTKGSAVANPAFDVTPARLVSGLVTERGVCEASLEGLLSLYPERRSPA